MLQKLHKFGFNLILLESGGKSPIGKWKAQQERRPSLEELLTKSTPDMNIGIVTGELRETGANVLGIDFDTEEVFRDVYPKFPESPMIAKTSRGFHAYYRLLLGERVPNKVRVGGRPIDFRHQGGYLVAPPSFNKETGVRYEWVREPVDVQDLPLFPMSLLPKEERVSLGVNTEVSFAGFETAKKYLASAGGAIKHQGWHRKAFRLACRLIHPPRIGFGLSAEDALSLLLWWNQWCQPKFTEKELTHKVADAIKHYPKG